MHACLGLVLTDFHLVCFYLWCVWVCWPSVRFDLLVLPFLVLPSSFACRVSVSECLQFCYGRLRCHRSGGLIHTVRQTPTRPIHLLPHLSLTLPWLWSVFVGATHPPGCSNVRPKPENCVCHEGAVTQGGLEYCLLPGTQRTISRVVLSSLSTTGCVSGRDRRLIVALWSWSWECSPSKSDKICFLLWLLCQPFWIISLNWATLHTDSHGYGCVVSSRHQPRPSGGAVGEGGEGWQLPGERQWVGAWSLCTLPIVSIWRSHTAQANRNTYLWH